MSGIQGLGSPAGSYAASLISQLSAPQSDGDEVQLQPGAALSPSQLDQLRRKLQQDVEQSFQQANQGKSLSDIGQTLRQKVSDTLAKYGFSESDRDSVLGQLDQLFGSNASRNQVRQQAQQLLQGVVDNLQGGSSAGAPASASGAPTIGQSLDLTG